MTSTAINRMSSGMVHRALTGVNRGGKLKLGLGLTAGKEGRSGIRSRGLGVPAEPLRTSAIGGAQTATVVAVRASPRL